MKISVTTIRIGDNTVNLGLLQDISERTGGRFYYVEDAHALPDLMLQDTTRALGPIVDRHRELLPADRRAQPDARRHRRAHDSHRSPAMPIPGRSREPRFPLQVTRLKRRDPILAVWRYGLGRVAAFTASPSGDAEQWWGWPQFGKFWSQLAHWTGREHIDGSYVVEALRTDGATELSVRAPSSVNDDAVLYARLHLDGGDVREIGLVSERPRSFTARVPAIPAGRYPLTIIRRSSDGEVTEQTLPVTIPEDEIEPRHELEREEPNLALLAALADGTGGKLNPSAREVVERESGSRRAVYPLDHLLLPLAMLLFLADVAVRRLKLDRGFR